MRVLEDQITELAAHIHAANYRLLSLIREFDEAAGWSGPGLRSCAHWLNWKCGINLGAAREKVRVAHALVELPLVSDAFSGGRVSYSKVRALTRVATAENEDFLLRIALSGTASHVERAVRQFRGAKRAQALEDENERHQQRKVVWRLDDDGSYVLSARLNPEQGERVRLAIEAAMEEIEAEQENVSAETSGEPNMDRPKPDPAEQRRADGLERLADRFLDGRIPEQATAVNAARCMSTPISTRCRKTVAAQNPIWKTPETFPRKRLAAWPATAQWSIGWKTVMEIP